MLEDAGVKLAAQAGEDTITAEVGPAEAAGREATEIGSRRDQNNGVLRFRGLDCCDDATGGATIDDDVVWLFRGAKRQGKDEDVQEVFHTIATIALGNLDRRLGLGLVRLIDHRGCGRAYGRIFGR